MTERDERNQKIADEFRANGGVVGGPFEGIPMLLLHHRGAKTGRERVNPLAYRREGGNYVIFASFGGRPENPAWYHNLRANAEAEIEVGTDTVKVRARVAEGDEREQIWTAQMREFPGFASYQEQTTRQIPVVILEPV